MDGNNIKSKAFSSVIWKFLERFSAQLVSFAVSVVLARILDPTDYSLVSIVLIFFTFSNVLISGGLNTALIQKKNSDEKDYSTILYVSVLLSIAVYAVLFFIAPLIAGFYEKSELTLMIRVMGIALPINAIKSIWCAYVSSNLMFKKFFFSTIIGISLSGLIGLLLAFRGAGAWALIAQQVSNIVIDTLVLFFTTRIKISPIMSFSRLKQLWSYGWKVFVSSILGTVYTQVTPLVIGIKFTTEDLSFYTRGHSFPELISSTSTSTVAAVLFPVLSKYQDSKEKLLQYTRRYISITSYIAFPLMLGLFAVADKFVIVLLTEKWLPAVPFIRVFCLAHMFDMVSSGNCETIKAMGRSDIFLIMEIIKKVSYFATISLFLIFGNSAIVLSVAYIVCAGIAFVVNSIPNKKMIGYAFMAQAKDMVPNLVISGVMALSVFLIGLLHIDPLVCMLLQIVLGILIYLLLSFVTKNEAFIYFLNSLKEFKRKRERV